MKTILNRILSLTAGQSRSLDEHLPDAAFSVRHKTACVTNYEKLYAHNYYAHQSGSTSYDIERFPRLLRKFAEEIGVDSLLDIGGGNGKLSQIWREGGGSASSLDYYDNPEENCKKFDLSCHDVTNTTEISSFISDTLGKSWISTCLDVAEHIDNEHLADFMLNLRNITGKALVISISTRPSSQANSFHSTVIPVETWKKIFVASGFEIYADSYFDELVRDINFVGTSHEIISVSHWHKINPFHDMKNHQHYLIVRIDPRIKSSPLPSLRKKISDILDISYRWDSRSPERDFPKLTYSIHFVQDWSFVRSIMNVWPADRLRITLREDCISQSYQKVIKGLLTQKGIDFTTLNSTHDARSLMSPPPTENEIWMTATEGNHSVTHQLNSSVMMLAREAGYRTISLQHGMTISSHLTPSSQVIGVWDSIAQNAFIGAIENSSSHSVEVLGSPRQSEASYAQQKDVIVNRFGEWTKGFNQHILVGLNLHWSVHQHTNSDTYAWLSRLLKNNPDKLFFIKPHPDDSSIYSILASMHCKNFVLVDDILLTSIDWPLMRLIKAVDGVITTYSTLIIDALSAGTPVSTIPSDTDKTSNPIFVDAWSASDYGGMPPVLTEEEWTHGKVPAFPAKKEIASDGLDEDEDFFTKILLINNTWQDLDAASSKIAAAKIFYEAARYINLNKNPHPDISALDEALEIFLS